MGCFSSTPSPPDNGAPTMQNHATPGGATGAGSASAGGSAAGGGIIMGTYDFKKKLDPRDFMCLDRKGEVVVKKPGDIQGQQFVIMDCEDCDIFLCDHCEMVTIDRCTNCRFFVGPCESSIFIRNCSSSKLVAACRQFRTRDCTDIEVLLHCASQPSIESSQRLRFGCFRYFYFSLEQQFEQAKLPVFNNRWSEVYSFTPNRGPEYELLAPEAMDPTAMLKPLHEVSDMCSADEADMWKTACPVPFTCGPVAAAGSESAVIVCMPKLGRASCFELSRAIQQDESVNLSRALEFRIDAQWGRKLDSALSKWPDRGPVEAQEVVVVLHLFGEGSIAKALAHCRAVAGDNASSAVYHSQTREESLLMQETLFVSEDSGHAIG